MSERGWICVAAWLAVGMAGFGGYEAAVWIAVAAAVMSCKFFAKASA